MRKIAHRTPWKLHIADVKLHFSKMYWYLDWHLAYADVT